MQSGQGANEEYQSEIDKARNNTSKTGKEETLLKLNMNVRGLQSGFMFGSRAYQQALNACKQRAKFNQINKVHGGKKSWMYRIPYFEQLSKIKCTLTEEELRCKHEATEKYLSELSVNLVKMDEDTVAKLDAVLEQLNIDWINKYGEIPERISALNRQQDRERSTLAVKERSSKGGIVADARVDGRNENIKGETGSKLTAAILNRSRYDTRVADLKSSYGPKVYTLPGTPEWDQLCNFFHTMQADNNIIFSIDMEAYEKRTWIVTEIGVTIYDPREDAGSTLPYFQSYHICPSESLHFVNSKYLPNQKGNFLLGETLVMPLFECVEFVQGLIDYYLVPPEDNDDNYNRIIVGHDVGGDLNWLEGLSVQLPPLAKGSTKVANAVTVLDTQQIYQRFYGQKSSSLGKVLRLHGIPHSYLHNAGNDAYYTLQLLLKMADIRMRRHRGWDDIYNVYDTLQEWERQDNRSLTFPDGSRYVELRDSGKKAKGNAARTRGSLRNWNTHLSGMAYHKSVSSFVESLKGSKSPCT